MLTEQQKRDNIKERVLAVGATRVELLEQPWLPLTNHRCCNRKTLIVVVWRPRSAIPEFGCPHEDVVAKYRACLCCGGIFTEIMGTWYKSYDL